MSEFTHILFDISEEIATITLNRPEARNALSPEMRDDMRAALKVVKRETGEGVKALILTGAGGAFCAGGDVKAMASNERTSRDIRRGLRADHDIIYDLMNIELPMISLVDGPAAGAGCNMALAADFVLATPRGMFMQAFGRIGAVPDWGGFFVLPRLVGLQKAKELVYTAKKVGAEEAKQIGLILDIVGQDTAMAEAREFAGRFRLASTAAIGMSKNILNQSFNLDHRTVLDLEADAQGMALTSPYHREAVRRFTAKEPAVFDWEKLSEGRGR
ncbi:MAG: enoyl-CoA hydratase/isomerase family protein [Alphaproteobacteria bacterium]|jgi:2-(1,2-epoxy-1,2-dihydrophenyl)acetyl-CoA isomerase|nr:enoyl-CoA hydratase/isomerase family protein [Alphaproteobacteria bacterium]MDP6568102.1 enoyl-CoA hydratase/isomerase family protein [Alphaproteobacteria bacterium]MDP6813815.1 enoyl-CoA hydratase/isomerase family protein [Alphaproteobacteria bacterium]